MTDPDTTSAEYTEVVIPVEKWIVFPDLEIPINGRKIHLLDLNSFDDILEVTTPIVRTEHAARDLSDFSDGGFIIVTILFFRTHKARVWMFGQNETEDILAGFTDLRSIGSHFHAIFDIRAAGWSEPPSALHLHNT
jgi:hypothetical protein